MQIYLYSEDKKVFTITRPAFVDPLETRKAGKPVYAFPPNSTTVAPPPFKNGEVAVFDEVKNCWNIIENNIGKKVYHKKTGKEMVVSEFGPIPSTYTEKKPILLQELKAEKIEEIKQTFSTELARKVEIGKIRATVGERNSVLSILDCFGKYKYLGYSNSDEETVKVTKEEVEEAEKYLYLRKMLLEWKRGLLFKAIKNCSSKKQLEKIDITFDIEDNLQKLMRAPIEDIDAFFAGE